MTSLNDAFTQLLEALKLRFQTINPTGAPQVYYLVFSPDQALEVKQQLHKWRRRLNDQGFKTQEYSFARQLPRLAARNALVSKSLELEAKSPLPPAAKFGASSRLLQQVTGAAGEKLAADIATRFSGAGDNSVLLLTDLEALHPAVRIGTIENQLTQSVKGPIIVFYPGQRTAKYALKFLGFYPEDGNYRSTHFEATAP
jgi:Domain of unknown function (DUF1788)